MLPKIYQWLYNVHGRSVVSNRDHYMENISSFLDSHVESRAKKVKSNIKYKSPFLKKLKETESLPKNAILCTIDVVGLNPNISHQEGLA